MKTSLRADSHPPTSLRRTHLWLLPVLLLATSPAWSQPPTIQAPTLDNANAPEVSAGVDLRLRSGAGARIERRQWRRNGQDVPGATLAYLDLKNLKPADAGDYTVVARNADGETVSPPLTLTVDPSFQAIDLPSLMWCGEWIDVNGDDWLDLVGWRGLPEGRSFVLLNARDGTFVTTWEQVWGTENWGLGFYRSHADYDNDGDPDMLCGWGPESLIFRNAGGGRFESLGSFPGGSWAPDIWVDIDEDGFLDVYRTAEDRGAVIHLNRGQEPPFTTVRPVATDALLPGWSLASKLATLTAAWGDYDDDGLLDVFVTMSGTTHCRLFHNEGAGVFAIPADFKSVTLQASFQAEWIDFDGDNDLDLAINPFSDGRCLFYRNQGRGSLVQLAPADTGDAGTDRTDNSCAMAWGDFDNDGDLDLYRTSIHWEYSGSQPQPECGRLYVNQGGGTFKRVRVGSPTAAQGSEWNWYLASWGDFDNDGFLDLVGSKHGNAGTLAYRNNLPRTGNNNGWLKVKCIGRVSNRDAVGAKVRVKATLQGESRWQLRQVMRSGGGGPLITHFGLADAPKVDVLRVEWPSGTVQEFTDLTVNQSLVLSEPPRLKSVGPTSFDVACWKGMGFGVEASTDLQRWTPVGTVMNTQGTARFNDAVPVHGTARFYRVVED